jgi:uncharacterized protein YjdB
MKKILLLAVWFVGFYSLKADAALTGVVGTGGTNICANLAVTGSTPAFTTLGPITVREALPGDITFGFHALVLNPPAGWQFDAGSVPTFTFRAGGNIAFVNSGGMTATALTVNIGAFGTTQLDTFTITGLQVQALTTGSAAGNVTASSAPGLTGITPGVSGFAPLSLTPSLVPSVAVAQNPAGAICAGTTVTFTATPTNGGVPTYQWTINGVPVGGATNTTFTSSTLTAGNNVRVQMTATGCVAPTSATSPNRIMTVNPIPAAVTVTGGGTFCNSTTLNASVAGPGAIFFQGVQSNGTSGATLSSSQVIVTPGTNTYYFRARTGATCWGPEGSAKVTINMPPSGLAIAPAAATSLCIGDSTTVIASATSPNVEVLQEDFNAGLGAWTITSTTGTATAFWQVRNAPGYNNIVSGDGSPYIEAAPDAAPGVTTNTIFTSPAFSLVGYTSATLTFNQYFQTWTNDSTVTVEYSTDGTTWTPFIDQLGATSGATSWLSTTPNTTMAIPAPALGQPSVQIRWNYRSFWGWYWAVDNISVKATPTLSYVWAGVGGATGLSCTTCDTVTVTPAVVGVNVYSVITSVSGCAATTNLTISVNALPTAFSVTGGGAYCAGDAGVNVGLTGSEIGVDYQLFAAGGAVGAPIAGTGLALDFGLQTIAGTYTVSATNGTTTCSAPMADSAIVVINPLPSAITGPTDICVASVVTLVDTSMGGTWSSSDITVADVGSASGDVNGIMAGTADITYTLATGCFVTHAVTVNALPVVAPITGIVILCESNSAALSDATPGGAWSSADATIAIVDALTGVVTGVSAGTATITYAVTDGLGCEGFATADQTVNALPAAAIMPAGPYVTMCNGNPANLVATDIVGATYQWSMAGTPIAGATNHSYIATMPGVYTLDMASGGCSWTLPSKTVLAAPVAVISYNSTGNYLYTGTFSTYQWFLNGTAVPGATSSILFSPESGAYTVVVADITGCTDTSDVYNYPTTGVNTQVVVSSIKVYPNPATSVIYIDAPVKVSVSVIAPDGRLIIRNTATNSIDVSTLANGVYMLQVYDENNTLLKTERFSKLN